MKIEKISIDKLKEYKKNARHHNVTYIKESIKEFGFKVPILVDKNNTIIAGHGRFKASKELGIKEVPIIRVEDLTDKQIKMFRLVDNKTSELSSWDLQMLEEELSELGNMKELGFLTEITTIDWNSIDEISEDNYEQPEKMKELYECPICHHKDAKIRFKSV